MNYRGRFMKLATGLMLLFALGLLVPQHVQAKSVYENAVPAEGDPRDGLDNDGGGGGSGTILPPDDGALDTSRDTGTISPTLLPQFVWFDSVLVQLRFAPQFVGHTLIWFPSFFEGGGR